MIAACPFPAPFGSQALIRECALALGQIGHEVKIVCFGYGRGDAGSLNLVRSIKPPWPVPVKPGPFLSRPLLDMAMIATTRRAIRKFKPDAVHAHNYEGLAVALAAGARNLVYHAHGIMGDELPHYLPGLGFMGGVMDHFLPRRAAKVIVPHSRLADWMLARGHSARNVHVVSPPCALPAISPHASNGDKPATIIYIGNRDRYQNLEFLCRVARLIKAKHPEIGFVAGTPDGVSPGEPFSAVRMDSTAAMQYLLAQDVVVACPRVSWSGYPIKILNAMAAERIVVASESCAYPLKDRWNGLIVPDGDEAAFADALVLAATDSKLRHAAGVLARVTVATLHDPANVARRMEEVYV